MSYDFSFYMPVNIIGGSNILENNKGVFSEFGKRCLIVTGASSAKKSGALDDVVAILDELNIDYAIFDKITENPLTTTCYEGGRAAREFSADYIIGIGGGSPLDASKAVCVYATNPQIIDDGIYTEKVENKPLPLIVIGTTSGTGSEVSGVSVLTRKNGRKQSVSGKNYYAKYALADAKYTYSVPFKTTVSTALDALAHAVESMFTKRADFLTTQFALVSIKMIYPILVKLNETQNLPTQEERDILYFASLYAGFALNKGGTGFPHGMGYALTEDYDVPHGIACAVFIPQYLNECEKANPTLFKQVLDAMNSDKESVEKLICSLCDLHISIPDERIKEYVSRWETLKNFKNSPTEFNNEDAGILVKKLFS
ncbi:MAG: iron-containing alcohol dehydrogenase [Clostridia bacterium]|nr:iron-containing alcohol dehydrogenase [Clostridia bacterium]